MIERPSCRPDDERRYIAHGWWSDGDTLWAWLHRHATERGGAPCVVSASGTLTWAELQRRVLCVAAGLRRKGIGAGDVVALQLPNVPEFLVLHLAIARLGAVTCTVHMPYRGAEIESILGHSGAKLFITGAFPLGELEDPQALPESHPAPDARDPFLLLYTSGTTASPKGVPHAYRTMLGNSRNGAREHRLGAGSRILCAAPFSHLYGLYSLHCAWSVGACSILLPAFKPDELNDLIQKHKPTALWCGPAHVAACRAHLDKWSSLELAIVSGSMAPPSLIEEFSSKVPGCAVTQLWGMTELQAGLYSRPGDAPQVHAASAGRPSPGAELRIAEDGELQIRGPSLFSAYYRNDAETARAFTPDGFFRTGDLARRVGENFAITGRSKDIINRGGVKFNPADVEVLLDSHPKVMQSAIVPMPDPILGEKACAFVTLKGKESPSLEELVAYLLSKGIAKNKLPERLVVVPEMPLTPTRKIIKGKLKI
jgi:acyl-CoA synthetase (AMP-forming)/AMP-acid ligase II